MLLTANSGVSDDCPTTRTEVVILDPLGLAAPCLSLVLEPTDQLLLLRIDADDRVASACEILAQSLDGLELCITIWGVPRRQTFPIALEGIVSGLRAIDAPP